MMVNTLEYKGYTGSVDHSPDDSELFGKILSIQGLVLYQGATLPELKQAFKEAVDDYLGFCEEEGLTTEKPA